MRVLVTGERGWEDDDAVILVMREFEFILEDVHQDPKAITIVHGDCSSGGIDRVAQAVGESMGFHVIPHPANWAKYGRAAGPIRNKAMLEEDGPFDLVLAFHRDISKSKGTKDCYGRANRMGLKTRLIDK